MTSGKTALHLLVSHGLWEDRTPPIDVYQMSEDAGADVGIQDSKERRPLDIAVEKSRKDILKFALKLQFETVPEHFDQMTVLQLATSVGETTVVETLERHPGWPYASTTKEVFNVLQSALAAGDRKLVFVILNGRDSQNRSVLDRAYLEDDTEAVETLNEYDILLLEWDMEEIFAQSPPSPDIIGSPISTGVESPEPLETVSTRLYPFYPF